MKIKRFINSVLACAMVCTAVPYVSYSVSENISITANAVDEYTEGTYQNLTYKAYEDHIEISKCDTTAVSVIVPSEIDDLPVTIIGDSAFSRCSTLTSITIPNSVTNIGDSAFSSCTNLKSIKIPDNITKFEAYTFSNCTGLTSIEIPNSITSIGNNTFISCTSLTSITIPDSVTNIGGQAFYETTWLESQRNISPLVIINNILIDGRKCKGNVAIPNNVINIVDNAFAFCSSLTSITIPNSVTNIEDGAFSNCTNLTSITIKNPECEIYDSQQTFYNYYKVGTNDDGKKYVINYYDGTIYGYENSTAQAYAEKYGYKFALIGDTPATDSPEKILGDANGDGTVDVADVVAISAYVGDSKNNPLSEQSILNGDVQNTGDGLTANDALMIQQYLSGNITTLE